MSEFFAMNGYGLFIWPCYGLTAFLVVGLYIHASRKLKSNS